MCQVFVCSKIFSKWTAWKIDACCFIQIKKTKLPKKEVIDEMDMEPSEEYMAAKEDAESRYEEGEEIDSIISTYHNLSFEDRNLLRQDLEGKMDGMDY